jgi:hypothetical protein
MVVAIFKKQESYLRNVNDDQPRVHMIWPNPDILTVINKKQTSPPKKMSVYEWLLPHLISSPHWHIILYSLNVYLVAIFLYYTLFDNSIIYDYSILSLFRSFRNLDIIFCDCEPMHK